MRAPHSIQRRNVQSPAAYDPLAHAFGYQEVIRLFNELSAMKADFERRLAEADAALAQAKATVHRGERGYQGVKGAKGDSVKGDPGPKGERGDRGEPGKTPTIDYGAIEKRVLAKIPLPKNENNAVDVEKTIDLVIESIQKGKKLKAEHVDGLEQTISSWRNQLFARGGYLHGGGVPSLSAGTNVTLTAKSDGGYTIAASGGSATIYTETPGGAVNGSNTTYTTAHTITTVIGMWINGEFIHPSEYTASGAGFTMNTALPSSLSGTGFTISYT